MPVPSNAITALHQQIRACTVCAAALPLGPRPVVQFSSTSRLVIISQAPGTRVHQTGIPWHDDSGARLRQWLGMDDATFYDPARVCLMPMGFCYPGKGRSGDLPPRRECAPRWHQQILDLLPPNHLTLLVGNYAQKTYLPQRARASLTENVRDAEQFLPDFFPLPHPSWRSTIWIRRNPWFEEKTLPALRRQVQQCLSAA
ncbi:uracil-DNA glycosylase family protein [Sinimarinibacterium sp. NLF-5-8]|uniref:uracil-DNA glycosylase family protein n=1 Tax=Sinimarinibacterium sp. NLF-5-8 TaxID=2698684 RepID=UPI00137C07F8|nr:uracil-DNA glycosylase family protein [Sinimarinibacterium sp. NLF-5-8]QHS08707.1 uracil-DNA glycosylase family protein [Sinimarinibacterium sp. NLF-5-8]